MHRERSFCIFPDHFLLTSECRATQLKRRQGEYNFKYFFFFLLKQLLGYFTIRASTEASVWAHCASNTGTWTIRYWINLKRKYLRHDLPLTVSIKVKLYNYLTYQKLLHFPPTPMLNSFSIIWSLRLLHRTIVVIVRRTFYTGLYVDDR